MARFNPADYIEVKDRIVKFWEKYPNGAIDTEILSVDERVVLMKAIVWAEKDDAKPIGTGHAEEVRITQADIARDKRKKYEPNATSAVENCETSAVGRALAMAGFEVSKSVASRQEMEKVQRQQLARENQAELLAKEETSRSTLDTSAEDATVGTSNGDEPQMIDREEAVRLAGELKSQIELSAVKLKLTAMGIETKDTLAGTLQTMSLQQIGELRSWVSGELNPAVYESTV